MALEVSRDRTPTPPIVAPSEKKTLMKRRKKLMKAAQETTKHEPNRYIVSGRGVDMGKAIKLLAQILDEQETFQRLNPDVPVEGPIPLLVYEEDSQPEGPSTKVASRGRTRGGIIRQGHSTTLQTDRKPPRRSKRIAEKAELAAKAVLEEKGREKRNIKANEGTSHDGKKLDRKPTSGRKAPRRTRQEKQRKVTESLEAQTDTMRGKGRKSTVEPKSLKRQAENDPEVSGMPKRRKL